MSRKSLRVSIFLLAFIVGFVLTATIFGCTSVPSARTEVKPGTSHAKGAVTRVEPSNTKKTRTVLRIRPAPSSQEKPR